MRPLGDITVVKSIYYNCKALIWHIYLLMNEVEISNILTRSCPLSPLVTHVGDWPGECLCLVRSSFWVVWNARVVFGQDTWTLSCLWMRGRQLWHHWCVSEWVNECKHIKKNTLWKFLRLKSRMLVQTSVFHPGFCLCFLGEKLVCDSILLFTINMLTIFWNSAKSSIQTKDGTISL